MRYAGFKCDEQVSVSNADGLRFHVGLGKTNGIVHIEGFSDAARGITKDVAILELIFSFCSEDGTVYSHKVLLSLWAIWPAHETVVKRASSRFKKEITLQAVMDTRDSSPLIFEDGTQIVSAHKYNDLRYELRAEESALAVRLRTYIGDLTTGTEESYLELDYEIPWIRLLWRPAPKLYEDDVEPEAESFCDIRRVGSLADRGMPKGLEPSPIAVE